MSIKNRDAITEYYNLGWEKDRLSTGKGHVAAIEGQIEKARTIILLERYLPPEPAIILDSGGAAGAYSFWLAAQGHQVHLVDLVPLHIEQARAQQNQPGTSGLASIRLGNACNLDFLDAQFDVVLCMGPLYHLLEQSERAQCLREAWRVLKPGGLLFAVGISRFGSLLDFMRGGGFHDPAINAMIKHDLATGCHLNPTADPQLFTTAYFHRPEDLRREMSEAGFLNTQLIAIEGPLLFTKDLEMLWSAEFSRQSLLAFVEAIEREPAIMGMSNHFVAVGYKGEPYASLDLESSIPRS